jgi:hypothetical protein
MTRLEQAIRAIAVCVTVSAATHSEAVAQMIPAQPMTAAECQAAAGAISPADPSGASWSRVAQCGSVGGTALANALSAARAVTDSVYLRSLLSASSRIRDPNLFAMTLSVAEDRTASDAARIIAMLIALQQVNNHNDLAIGLSWSNAVTYPWGTSCQQLVSGHEGGQYSSETSLPANAAVQLGTRLDAIVFASPPNLQAVIDPAKCVRARISAEAPDSVDPVSITLSYVCGNMFRVTNTSPKWIDASYVVVRSTESGDLEVAPNTSKDFEVDRTGTVTLTYLGKVIRQAANSATVCPP